jgi:hypothetical protein
MDSYIIRIYRRHDNDRLTGIVEDIEAQIEIGFNDRDELWKILLERGKRISDSKERRGKRRM